MFRKIFDVQECSYSFWFGGGEDLKKKMIHTKRYSSHAEKESLRLERPLLPKFDYKLLSDDKSLPPIPSSFDWRTQKDLNNKAYLPPPLDQGVCGSCYAFCSAQMLSARFAIASEGSIKPILSPQDLVTCGKSFVNETYNNPQFNEHYQKMLEDGILFEADEYALEGCDGGLLASSLGYLVIRGLPELSKVPYSSINGSEPSSNYCFTRDKNTIYYAHESHSLTDGIIDGVPSVVVTLPSAVLKENIENMQRAIMEDGPIITAMNIFTDFLYYPHISPVYQKYSAIVVNGNPKPVVLEGGHAVMIVGWDEAIDEDTNEVIPYWICQNSWGTDWGLNGYFYIRRGNNEANIEFNAASVFPGIGNSDHSLRDGFQPIGSVGKPSSDKVSTSPTMTILIILLTVIIVIAFAVILTLILLRSRKQ